MTAKELIQGCINNDQQAQKGLYDQFSPVLYATCIRYLGCKDDAADALQQSFIKIFNSIHNYKFQGSFEGWMKRIAIYTSLDLIKKKSALRFEELNDFHDVQYIDDKGSETSKITYNEIIALVDLLPDGYRAVFNMYVLDGLGHDEIAQALDISYSTSRSQLHKARKLMQKFIKENYNQIMHNFSGR